MMPKKKIYNEDTRILSIRVPKSRYDEIKKKFKEILKDYIKKE